jgi:hypothetical protein
MGRYDIASADKQSIAAAVRCGDIGRAVELANRLIWVPFTAGAGWMPLASESRVKGLVACRPKILKAVPDDTIALLNFAAVMAELLGPQYRKSEWLPEKPSLGLPMTQSSAVNMFNLCVRHYEQVGLLTAGGITQFEIHVCHNTNGTFPTCPVCEPLTDTVWTKETIPELPYEKCVNALGCRCLAMPVIK